MAKLKEPIVVDGSKELTGVQKAAVLMISLGVDTASMVLKELRDIEVEQITLEIASMRDVNPDVVERVMREFYNLMLGKKYMLEGGLSYAKDVLTRSKGKAEAEGIMKRLENETGTDAFSVFQSVETANIVQFLQNEHPQIAAIILAHLEKKRAAEILTHLRDEYQSDVSYRLATMGKISSDVISEIEEVILDQMSGIYSGNNDINRGSAAVANILNETNIATEHKVLEEIAERDPELAEEIKQQMFLFEDILEMDDRSIQLIISVVDKSDLVMALKGADNELVRTFLRNMSSRASEMLKEDMEALGAVHKKQVEEAQQRIIRKIRDLEGDGQISTRKASSEEMIT